MRTAMDDFVYILIEREFIKCKESVYKIGRTKDLRQRFQAYPKGSKLLVSSIVADSKFVENQIIKTFKQKFKQRTDIGTEYFEGMFVEMQKEFNNIVNSVVELQPTTQSPAVPISPTVVVPVPKQEYTFTECHSFEYCTLKMHPKGAVSERTADVKQASAYGNPRATNSKWRMWTCECGFKCSRKFNMERHMATKGHLLKSNGKDYTKPNVFECKTCNYITSIKSNLKKHERSSRHEMRKRIEDANNASEKSSSRPVYLNEVVDMFMKLSSEARAERIQNTEMFKSLVERVLV